MPAHISTSFTNKHLPHTGANNTRRGANNTQRKKRYLYEYIYTPIPDTTSVSIMWSPMAPSPGTGYTAIVLFYPLASLEENCIILSVASVWQRPSALIQTGRHIPTCFLKLWTGVKPQCQNSPQLQCGCFIWACACSVLRTMTSTLSP